MYRVSGLSLVSNQLTRNYESVYLQTSEKKGTAIDKDVLLQ